MSRPNMRFVSVKSRKQQDIKSIHRIRDKLLVQKASKANQIRGLVSDYGLVAPVGINKLREAIPPLAGRCRKWFIGAVSLVTTWFVWWLKADPRASRYARHAYWERSQKWPCRTLTAWVTRYWSSMCQCIILCYRWCKKYRKGRGFAASIGLSPRQHSTGGKPTLLGISKRGDGYLRKLLVHSARSVIRHAYRHDDNLSKWIEKLCASKHINTITVALVNKAARAAWAMVNTNGS